MNMIVDHQTHSATITLAPITVDAEDVVLDRDVVATIDGGVLVGVEVLDTRTWGAPFDDAVAGDAVEWTRTQLPNG